jgi:hypothetical protein
MLEAADTRGNGSNPYRTRALREELLPDKPTGLRAGRAREDRAGGVQRVLVERVGGRQPLLDGGELSAGAALEGNKEQARIDLAAPRFHGFAVGVTPSEDPLPLVGVRAGETNVRIGS